MPPIFASTSIALAALSILLLCRGVRLRRAYDRLLIESRTDALTGCRNRRSWDEKKRKVLNSGGFSFILFDLANLKAANTALGHAGADEILIEVAASIRADGDDVYRIGGDEFLVVLPGAARNVAVRICERIEKRVGTYWPSPDAPVFAAAGIGTWSPGDSFTQKLLAADKLLEELKASRKRALGVPTTRDGATNGAVR